MPRVHRFIPAYAGNAHARERIAVSYTVHPRIRGERKLKSKDKEGTDGSSPHTRGTRRPKTPTVYRQRFIPAYAGNALSSGKKRSVLTVHPRIRGERGESQRGWNRWDGSSPHTRGTPENQHLLPRFIPAYAGNASAPQQRGCPGSVHPRIRGERYPLPSTKRLKFGSSPHTRGTPISVECWPKSVRFIPAYAGNAINTAGVPQKGPVHPRIRGERLATLLQHSSCHGSSPHTRGTPSRNGRS